MECVHFILRPIRRSFRKLALKQRDRGRSVATPLGTSADVVQTIGNIHSRPRFFPLPTSFLPPSAWSLLLVVCACLRRVFYPSTSKAGGVVRFSYLPLFVRFAMRRTLRHSSKKMETPFEVFPSTSDIGVSYKEMARFLRCKKGDVFLGFLEKYLLFLLKEKRNVFQLLNGQECTSSIVHDSIGIVSGMCTLYTVLDKVRLNETFSI